MAETLIKQGLSWWAHKGSNLGPLPCEGNALPLSYAPGIIVHGRCKPDQPRDRVRPSSEPAIYEVRGSGVKRSEAHTGPRRSGALLAGAGGVGLQRPDALGERAAAFGGRRLRPRHWPASWRRWRPCAGDRRFRRQHGLDRRIRPFELHRELGDFGGDVVDALAQQRIFHALGRPGAFGLLLDRVDVALQLGAFVAGDAKLFLDRGLLGPQLFERRRLAAVAQAAISSRNSLHGALGGLVGLAQLVVFIVALGQQLALRGKPRFQIVDAVAEHLGFLDLDDQLAIEIGDALAQILDPAARLVKFARRGLGFAALLRQPRLRRGKFLLGVADAVLQFLDLGAHRDQFDLAAVRHHRTVGQFGD